MHFCHYNMLMNFRTSELPSMELPTQDRGLSDYFSSLKLYLGAQSGHITSLKILEKF